MILLILFFLYGFLSIENNVTILVEVIVGFNKDSILIWLECPVRECLASIEVVSIIEFVCYADSYLLDFLLLCVCSEVAY